jgi:hypothetical protein
MELSVAAHVIRSQDGVIARRQALECGLDDNDLERLLRRRELARIHPGVYVDHTGAPSWSQRAWAAVQFHWPAGLAGASALRAHGLRSAFPAGLDAGRLPGGSSPERDRVPQRDLVHVVVDAARRVVPPPGVFVTRRVDFERRVQLHLSPPRLRLDEALLDVASSCRDEATAVALLADACQQGSATAGRLHEAASARGRLPRRRALLEILADVAMGSMSVFERRYLVDVERAHGLPAACRQVRVVTRGGVTYRDVEYADQRVVVELDGRFVHVGPRLGWADVERDVEGLIGCETTMRLGWAHVLKPCPAALLVARLLNARGWSGAPHPRLRPARLRGQGVGGESCCQPRRIAEPRWSSG